MENLNLPENLEKLKHKIFEHMKSWTPAPNVQMHVPPADFPDASEHAAHVLLVDGHDDGDAVVPASNSSAVLRPERLRLRRSGCSRGSTARTRRTKTA